MHALVRGLRSNGSLLTSVRAVASAAGSAGSAAGGKPVAEKEFLIYRWNPESDAPPRYDSYKVDINA